MQKRQHASEAGYVPTVSASTRTLGQDVEIRVRDNGTGMGPEVQAKIFQPFFITNPTGEGTGLGLSLSLACDTIAKGHGGTLAVTSAEGEDPTFILRLPQFSA